MTKRNRILLIITCIFAGIFGGLLFFLHMPEQQYRQKLTLGQRFLYTKDYQKAEAEFQSAIHIQPKKKDAYEGMVAVYMTQADEISDDDPEQAEQYYKEASSYAEQAKTAGAGDISVSDYGSYQPQEEIGSSSGTSDTESTESANSTTTEGGTVDFVSLGKGALRDAKERYSGSDADVDEIMTAADGSPAVEYALYDFTGDGIRDMVVTIMPDEQSGARYFYRFDDNKAECVGQENGVIHMGLTVGYKNGIACQDGSEFSVSNYLYRWSGSQMEEENLSSGSSVEDADFKVTLDRALDEAYPTEEDRALDQYTSYVTLNWRDESDLTLLKDASKERTDLDYESIYQPYIQDAAQRNNSDHGVTTGETYAGMCYTLLDVNRDGILDLIVDAVHAKHGAALYVYSFDGSTVHYLGSVEKDTSGFDFAGYGQGFAFTNCYKGYYSITFEECTADTMIQTSSNDGEVDREAGYDLDDANLDHLVRPIGWFDYTDPSLLQKPYCPYAA